MFVAKSKMKRINATVCARTNECGANHGPVSLRLHLCSAAKQPAVVKGTDDATRFQLFGFWILSVILPL